MATRPDKLPEWASGAADSVEPSTGRKAVGWIGAERPAAEFFNWLLNYIYLWCFYLSDGIISRVAVADDSPIWQFQNRDNKTMMYADVNGYFGFGPGIFEQHIWGPINNALGASLTDAVVSPRMVVNSGANTETRILGSKNATAIAGAFGPTLSLEILNAATTESAYVTYPTDNYPPFGGDGIDDSILVWEARVALTHVGAQGVNIRFGFSETPGAANGALDSFVMFEKDSVDTNWLCQIADNTLWTTGFSGVPPVANIWQTFRVEMHGQNTAIGVDNGFGTARFFIDGVLVSELADANFPITADTHAGFFAFFYIEADGVGPTTTIRAQIQTKKVAWQEVATPHIPA